MLFVKAISLLWQKYLRLHINAFIHFNDTLAT